MAPDSATMPDCSAGMLRTPGSNNQMIGKAITPTIAVNTIRTAVSLCLKYFSTRYLSICVETPQDNGPSNANKTQNIEIDCKKTSSRRDAETPGYRHCEPCQRRSNPGVFSGLPRRAPK